MIDFFSLWLRKTTASVLSIFTGRKDFVQEHASQLVWTPPERPKIRAYGELWEDWSWFGYTFNPGPRGTIIPADESKHVLKASEARILLQEMTDYIQSFAALVHGSDLHLPHGIDRFPPATVYFKNWENGRLERRAWQSQGADAVGFFCHILGHTLEAPGFIELIGRFGIFSVRRFYFDFQLAYHWPVHCLGQFTKRKKLWVADGPKSHLEPLGRIYRRLPGGSPP